MSAAPAPAPWMIDLRVGKIVQVEKHPNADSLYVEQIDIGEEQPRTVVSGLVKYVPIDQMRDRSIVVVANMKPANMRSIKSHAMVLCASAGAHDADERSVELITPPEGTAPGDRLLFQGFEDKEPLDVLNPKKKIFETVQPGLKTLDSREAAYVDPETGSVHKLVASSGSVAIAPTLANAPLS